VPYVSWFEGEFLSRHRLDGDCWLGRDPLAAALARPGDPSVSRVHAMLFLSEGRWWLRDGGSRNGTLLNGQPVVSTFGCPLADGDEIRLGDWLLTYTQGFPGLDGLNFIEGVGDLFAEVRPEPSQSLALVRGMELLHQATEALLREASASSLVRSLLDESLKLLEADRGFVVIPTPEGGWKSVHRVGDVQDRLGLSQSVLDYVGRHKMAVLSNAPTQDPRFGGSSLVELERGALMCAPMAFDGNVLGILYLDRSRASQGFSRFDLALFQAFVRLGAITLRHTQLTQKAIGHAEVQGELLRLKVLHERLVGRTGEIFGSMSSSLRWLQGYAEAGGGREEVALAHQVERLQALVEMGTRENLPEAPGELSCSMALGTLHGELEKAWGALLGVRGAELHLDAAPGGQVWMAGGLVTQGLLGLVEPLLMQVAAGESVRGRWTEASGDWTLALEFPGALPPPSPDPWTLHALRDGGVEWHWNNQVLTVSLAKSLDQARGGAELPLLGLVTEDVELMGLFESVAEAGGLSIYPLDLELPRAPLPVFAYLVLDAKGLADPAASIQAFRRHPSFLTVPILVVRAPEGLFSTLLAVGATDWLPEGFRWEMLHHRLQVLKGHEELQRKALAAERLESFRQMAGTLKHEINNPLAVISMQVELLARKYPDEPKFAKIGDMVERIRGLMQVLQKMRESKTEDYPGGTSILKLS